MLNGLDSVLDCPLCSCAGPSCHLTANASCLVRAGGGDTRQEDDEESPTQSRISPSIQGILR